MPCSLQYSDLCCSLVNEQPIQTICHEDWDMQDAKVLCKQLLYEDAIVAVNGVALDSNDYRLVNLNLVARMTKVDCKGDEGSIEVIISTKANVYSKNLLDGHFHRYASTGKMLLSAQAEKLMPE